MAAHAHGAGVLRLGPAWRGPVRGQGSHRRLRVERSQKLYTYAQFLSNFTASVTLSGSGPGGGTVVGLQPFVVQRRALLANHAEITAPAPVIDWIHHEPTLPAPGDAVYVTADVAPGGVPVASVSLYYLATPGSYQQVSMLDDGLHADFAAGDGIYGALLPITASSGQEVKYYVAATSANTYGTVSFEPALTELAPATLQYSFGTSGLRITEYLYSGTDGEFVEFTNTTAAPIDLTGWSMDDQSALPGTLDLSAAGVLAPGASFLVTDADPVAFAAAWGLSGTVVIGPNADAALGRNDEINLFDASGDLVERLTYGDEDFPGSVRAKDASAQGCWQALGNNNPFGWSLSVVGDAHGSFASSGGDVGSPGVFALVTCSGLGNTLCDPAVANSTGGPATLTAFGSPYAETNRVVLVASALPPGEFGFFLNGTAAGFVANPGGSMGNLCLGGSLGRYNRASEIFAADATGQGSLALDLSNTPTPTGPTAVLAGQTWYYQCWYRDTSVTSSNFTGALEIVYQ
ncbi:MAG: lamin tail domain-containing protein [Planctomycetota bacterium]